MLAESVAIIISRESRLSSRRSKLLLFELLTVIAFVAVVAVTLLRPRENLGASMIDVEALSTGPSSSEWFGVYFEDQKIGYAVTSRTATKEGGLLIHSEAAYTIASFGSISETVMASSALLDSQRLLTKFDFFMSSNPVRLSASGEVSGNELKVTLHQGGEAQELTLPLDAPPQLSLSLNTWLVDNVELREGASWEVPYFDPVTLAQNSMTMKVVGTEIVAGEEEAYWVERSVNGATTRVLVTTDGQTIREESAFGFSMVRETAEEARSMPDSGEVVDVIDISIVPLQGMVNFDSAQAAFEVEGVEASEFIHGPPLQTVEGDVVRVSIPDPAELPSVAVRAEEPEAAPFLEATPFLPIGSRAIWEKAEEVVGGSVDRLEATQRLVTWVYEYLDKRPTVGIPNALEVLQVGQGDCNEHTALFVALARASGIPARTAAGMVHLQGGEGLYYHAWPEVWFGPEGGWLPVDPTFGELPANPTHLKLVEGGLDKQIEILSVLGRVRLKVVPW